MKAVVLRPHLSYKPKNNQASTAAVSSQSTSSTPLPYVYANQPPLSLDAIGPTAIGIKNKLAPAPSPSPPPPPAPPNLAPHPAVKNDQVSEDPYKNQSPLQIDLRRSADGSIGKSSKHSKERNSKKSRIVKTTIGEQQLPPMKGHLPSPNLLIDSSNNPDRRFPSSHQLTPHYSNTAAKHPSQYPL